MTQSRLSLPEDLPYPTDADFAEENPGQHDHPEEVCRAFWSRIWRKWKDRRLCFEWYRYRRWHTLEAWEYGFTELAKKQRNDPTEVSGNPINLVKWLARKYEADPDRHRKQDAPPSVSIAQPAIKPTVASEEKRRWYEEYHRKQAAKVAARAV